ncbi:MAG: cache domain-containing protein [Desulfobacula sp.]|jgi:hypothetical protein|nr:cache domain-containing protein [Desulfobacula sp.]
MTIRAKLYLSLIAIVILPGLVLGLINIRSSEKALKKSISSRIQNVAIQGANSIETVFYERLSEARGLALNPSLIEAVKLSNKSFSGVEPEKIKSRIDKIDNIWIKEGQNSKIARQIHSNPISEFLKKYSRIDPEKYGEIFITNAFGTNIGCTKILSDYFQADEDWWQQAFNNGKGEIFIDDRGYDESIKTLVTGIVVPIMDNGSAIGILKINFKIDQVIELVSTDDQSKTNIVSLVRSLGSLIVSSDKNRDGLSELELKVMKTNEGSGWITDFHQNSEMIIGFSPVNLKINTRVPTIGVMLRVGLTL